MRVLLHGGNESEGVAIDPALAHKLIASAKECGNRFLACFFASPKDEEYIQNFTQIIKDIDQEIFVDIADEKLFQQQMEEHDVIFFQGGKTKILLRAMARYNVETLKNKKLLAGSSAGANYLSTIGITNGEEIVEGIGIAPVAVLVHSNDWPQKKCVSLIKEESNLPIMLLPEENFIELEVNSTC